MKKITFFILILLFITSCSSSEDFENGKKQLENMGYTDIENTGYSSFCCSDGDSYSTGFSCKNKKGETIEGCFCSGLSKGVTIRFK